MGRSEGHTPELSDPSLTAVINEFQERIHRYILQLVRDPAEADDLTQDTFLRAHRKLDSLRDPATLSVWLYRIATNVCYDRFRSASYREKRQQLRPESSGDQIEASADDEGEPRLDRVLEQAEMSACVREFIERLSDGPRMVILLHDLHGMTSKQIAQALGCSLATVKIRLHRARRRLKKILAAVCEFSVDDRGVLVCDRKPSRN